MTSRATAGETVVVKAPVSSMKSLSCALLSEAGEKQIVSNAIDGCPVLHLGGDVAVVRAAWRGLCGQVSQCRQGRVGIV